MSVLSSTLRQTLSVSGAVRPCSDTRGNIVVCYCLWGLLVLWAVATCPTKCTCIFKWEERSITSTVNFFSMQSFLEPVKDCGTRLAWRTPQTDHEEGESEDRECWKAAPRGATRRIPRQGGGSAPPSWPIHHQEIARLIAVAYRSAKETLPQPPSKRK